MEVTSWLNRFYDRKHKIVATSNPEDIIWGKLQLLVHITLQFLYKQKNP